MPQPDSIDNALGTSNADTSVATSTLPTPSMDNTAVATSTLPDQPTLDPWQKSNQYMIDQGLADPGVRAAVIEKNLGVKKYWTEVATDAELAKEGEGGSTKAIQTEISKRKKSASLAQAIKASESNPVYSEQNDPNVDNALASPKVALGTLGQQTPNQRAMTGAQFGADLGKNGGPVGAMVGASIGAIAGRSAGSIQSGEHELNTRIGKLGETVDNLGLLDKKGNFNFEDGTSVPFLQPQGTKLPNLDTSILTGSKDRLITELDPTNPLSKRAGCVAQPLGRYLMSGVLGYNNAKDPKDAKSAKDAVNIFTNSLTTGADNINTVYDRGREILKKLKVPKDQLLSFFKQNAGNLSENDAKEIKQGIDILYNK